MLTFAVCSYNRAGRLAGLIPIMRRQECRVPFEILIVDNNSTDDTRAVVQGLAEQDGPPVRYVFEPEQGIPYARNRALEESMGGDYLVFIDDDEIPRPGLLNAAIDALEQDGADCAGGRVEVIFKAGERPSWLGDELLGFLAEIDHGEKAFWITDRSTPIWTANVAYRTDIFRDNEDLRFDVRYNRRGQQVGGGSDAVMFWALLEHKVRIRYRPDMVVEHYVEPWRLRRRYFLKLHFVSGRKYGQYQTGDYPRTVFGVPPFMVSQAMGQWLTTFGMLLKGRPGVLRQAMNGAHASGAVWGRLLRWSKGGGR